jgi:hypothetical protein
VRVKASCQLRVFCGHIASRSNKIRREGEQTSTLTCRQAGPTRTASTELMSSFLRFFPRCLTMLSACKILEAAFLDFDGDCGAELEGGNGRAYRSGEKA